MENLIEVVLKCFKNRLDQSNELLIQRSLGYSIRSRCEFYKPATLIELDEFQQTSGFAIPSDLQDFLLIHNGAKLFYNPEVYDDPPWYFFSLEEIVSAIKDYSLPDDQYPIAKYDDVLICINNDSLEIKKRNYLYVRSIYTPSDNDGEQLHLSFEIFLDRLIVSHGEHFWDWPKITSEVFYRNK